MHCVIKDSCSFKQVENFIGELHNRFYHKCPSTSDIDSPLSEQPINSENLNRKRLLGEFERSVVGRRHTLIHS